MRLAGRQGDRSQDAPGAIASAAGHFTKAEFAGEILRGAGGHLQLLRNHRRRHQRLAHSTLSRGAFRGLAAQSTRDGEVLVGLPSGGGSKLSTEMSTATRNQLYLALRIAAYREFVKTRRRVPFVLDDVLETFDDDRAEASLALLADLANTGQVIYLTHHKHLCEIARRVCPDAKLHDLGALDAR